MAIACENGGRRVVPLQFRVWSAKDPCYASENAEVEKVVVFLEFAIDFRAQIR